MKFLQFNHLAVLGLLGFQTPMAFGQYGRFLPVCERTPAVVQFIERDRAKPCAEITEDDLALIKRIAVPNRQIAEFKADDFTGLPNLEILNIKGNPTKTLPAGLMSDLPKLRVIVLFGNGLEELPEDFLENNPLIEDLHIFDNPFSTIPEAVFERIVTFTQWKNVDFNEALLETEKERLRARWPEESGVFLNFY
jgi:Leucine-rich repeat (LRR) protein